MRGLPLTHFIVGLPPSLFAQDEHEEDAESSAIDKDGTDQTSKPVNDDKGQEEDDDPGDKSPKCFCDHVHSPSMDSIARGGKKSRKIFFP